MEFLESFGLYEPFDLPSYGLNSATSLLQGWLWHQIIHEN